MESNRTTRRSVSPWLPVSLIAVTTAALTVPVLLFRKQRAALLEKSLRDSPAPLRRTGTNVSPQWLPANSQRPPATNTPPMPVTQAAGATKGFSDFSPRLHAVKALGIATLLVMAGSVTAVWGVRSWLNVNNTQEFADLARRTIRTKIPVLSSKIYRPTDLTEDDKLLVKYSSEDTNWSWPAAEMRLKEAFAEGGFAKWIEVAFNEIEAEARVERLRRTRYNETRSSIEKT